jgi:hypothetical protein
MQSLIKLFILSFSLTLLVSFDWFGYVCNKIERTYVMTSMALQGFTCTTKTAGSCTYSQCEGKIGNYPRPVLVTVPQEIESLGLHFHGHLLNNPTSQPYNGSLPSMIKKFGMENSLCNSKQMTVFPSSRGNNSDYLDYFKTPQNYTQFMEHVHTAFGWATQGIPLHLSGHSGGGKYVANALAAGVESAGVTIYDGIYSETTKQELKKWYQKTQAPLTLVTVKGMSPEDFVSNPTTGLKTALGIKSTPNNLKIAGVNYEVTKVKNFTHFSRYAAPVTALQAHYDVVNHIWPRELQFR